jgi:hypothetical protein
MDLTATVPASWFALVGGVLIASFIWWLKREFDRNDREHVNLASDHKTLHRAITRVHRRMDHIIIHMNLPPYRDRASDDIDDDEYEIDAHHIGERM